jgi:hypothetical protein
MLPSPEAGDFVQVILLYINYTWGIIREDTVPNWHEKSLRLHFKDQPVDDVCGNNSCS